MGRLSKTAKYRNPGFMGGLCAVCRKTMRDYRHPDYPSMCVRCRETRLKPFVESTLVPQDVSTARNAGLDAVLSGNGVSLEEARRFVRERYGDARVSQPAVNPYVYEKDIKRAQTKCVHGRNIDHCGQPAKEEQDSIQNLNCELHPLIKRMLK